MNLLKKWTYLCRRLQCVYQGTKVEMETEAGVLSGVRMHRNILHRSFKPKISNRLKAGKRRVMI